MLPAPLNLHIYGGDAYTLIVEVVDDDGDPLPLTGEWAAQVRSATRHRLLGADFTVDIAEQAAGRLTLRLTADESAELADAFNQGIWDLEGSDFGTIAAGSVTVATDVTRTEGLDPAGAAVTATIELVAARATIVAAGVIGPPGPPGPPGPNTIGGIPITELAPEDGQALIYDADLNLLVWRDVTATSTAAAMLLEDGTPLYAEDGTPLELEGA